TTETGLGERDPRSADVQAPARSQRAATEVQPVEYETDERSEVAVQTPNPERRPRREQPAGERTQSGAAAEPAAEKPRQVDRRALFPGRTAGSTSASEGTSQGAGNAGDPSGAPEGSHEGTGQGSAGIAYDLSGRSVAGRLPEPLYPGNESGKVIVDVEVDASGKVIRASYRAKGSTTGSTELIDAAVSAAYKARFSQSEALIQHGTITYVFKLNG
ncbi:MAG: energy transducer TonB, partial [Alistipes sp.]|nr:energy transducer TonB [Alistipes sp.]